MHIFNYKKGFTVMEMLIYVAILALFALFVFEIVVVMSNSYKKIAVSRIIASSAVTSMERMTREIKGATDVDSGQSILNASPGKLRILTTNEADEPISMTFMLESGRVNLYENDVLVGPLTGANTSTTRLEFNIFSNAGAKSVGIIMTVEAEKGTEIRSEDFRTTTIIRNSL